RPGLGGRVRAVRGTVPAGAVLSAVQGHRPRLAPDAGGGVEPVRRFPAAVGLGVPGAAGRHAPVGPAADRTLIGAGPAGPGLGPPPGLRLLPADGPDRPLAEPRRVVAVGDRRGNAAGELAVLRADQPRRVGVGRRACRPHTPAGLAQCYLDAL